jgi:uncharacterized protein YifE (UPF0438 family)
MMRKESEYTEAFLDWLAVNGKPMTKNEAISVAVSLALRLSEDDFEAAWRLVMAEREALQSAGIL